MVIHRILPPGRKVIGLWLAALAVFCLGSCEPLIKYEESQALARIFASPAFYECTLAQANNLNSTLHPLNVLRVHAIYTDGSSEELPSQDQEKVKKGGDLNFSTLGTHVVKLTYKQSPADYIVVIRANNGTTDPPDNTGAWLDVIIQ